MARMLCIASLLLLSACPGEHPAEPVPVKGKEVQWGENFTMEQQVKSAPATGPATKMGQPPGPAMSWSGGDKTRGRDLFNGLCIECHGAGNKAPALAAKDLADMTDRDLARVIAHGREGMPSFMGRLDRQGLADIIAGLRSGAGAAGPSSAPTSMPASRPAE